MTYISWSIDFALYHCERQIIFIHYEMVPAGDICAPLGTCSSLGIKSNNNDKNIYPLTMYYWCFCCVFFSPIIIQDIIFLLLFVLKSSNTEFLNCCPLSNIDQKEPQVAKRNEPPHDKTNKMACASSKDSDQPGHLPSLITVITVHMKKTWVLSYPLSTQQRLIRLGGCPGWSESSLGSQSFSWFCHEVAQIK